MPTRRGHHDGSISRRADGRWEARLTLDGGKRRSWYGTTRAEVAHKLAEAQRDKELGTLEAAPSRLTVETFLADWLDAVQPTVRPRTFARYQQLVTQHALPSLGGLTVGRLSPGHLQHLYAAKLAEGLAPRTVRLLHAVLHRALGQAKRQGLVQTNVAELVSPPRAPRHSVQTLSEDQARAFLDAAKGERLYALYVLALSTGMRQGELMALSWRQVDMSIATLRVTGSLQRIDGKQEVVEPKTRGSRRAIALPPFAVMALRAHASTWQSNAGALLFTNLDGTPLVGTVLTKQFQRILKAAGLPRIRFHDLRHTAATLLLGRGVHPKIVSEMLGHSSISMTLDLYSHVTPSMQAEAAAVLDGVLTGRQ
jgi:integrase